MEKQLFFVRRNSGVGGAERVAERLAQSFSDKFDVHRLWAGNVFNNHLIPGTGGPPWWRAWRYTRYINQLPIYQKNSVVYSLEYGPDCDIYRAGDGIHFTNLLRRYGNNKLWMTNPWHWLAPILERNSFESARYIIANSEMVRKDILDAYPFVENKIIKIYNGFDKDLFYPANQDKLEIRQQLGLPLVADKMLLLSGSGFKRKGLHYAIEVLANLHQRGCKAYLVVVGKGDSGYVKGAINKYNLEDFVLFKGLVKNVAQYYQAVDIMILLTLYDQFSNSCLEALACGCPVVTTRDNGAVEVMQPYSGLVVGDASTIETIKQCGDYIAQHVPDYSKIANSVLHLSSENEKNLHLDVINRVFSEKK